MIVPKKFDQLKYGSYFKFANGKKKYKLVSRNIVAAKYKAIGSSKEYFISNNSPKRKAKIEYFY